MVLVERILLLIQKMVLLSQKVVLGLYRVCGMNLRDINLDQVDLWEY